MIDLNKFLAKPNKSIRQHTDELLDSAKVLKELNYIDEKKYEILKLSCEYHDYGKINDEFQKRVSSKRRIIFNNKKEVAHNVLSIFMINKEKFETKDDYSKVCYAILNHHHNTNNYNEIEEKEELIEKFILKFGGKKIKPRLISKLQKFKENTEAQLLKGLLHKCDYSASGEYKIEYPNDFLINGLSDLLKKWKDTNKNSKWNELQNFCLENTNKNIIVVANTGMGKTEAGLLWIGNNKGFFILPLKTAISDFPSL